MNSPRSQHVAVCGAGIVGLGCAHFLRACNAGHVARSAPLLRDLNFASRELYVEFADTLAADFLLVQRGLLMLCREERTVEQRLFVRKSQTCPPLADCRFKIVTTQVHGSGVHGSGVGNAGRSNAFSSNP